MDQGGSPGPGGEEPTPQRARVPEGGAISPEVRPRPALAPRGGEWGLGNGGWGWGGRLFRRVCSPGGKGERREGGEDGIGMGLESPPPAIPTCLLSGV